MLDLSCLKVLVVGDIASIRTLLRTLLRTFAIKSVLEARDGSAALDLLASHPVDLIIADLKMKPMDGIEFTRQLRTPANGLNPCLPVLMVSGYTDKVLVKSAIQAGVTQFLAKPLTVNSLGQRLKAITEKPIPIVQTESYCGPDRRRKHFVVTKLRRRSDNV